MYVDRQFRVTIQRYTETASSDIGLIASGRGPWLHVQAYKPIASSHMYNHGHWQLSLYQNFPVHTTRIYGP